MSQNHRSTDTEEFSTNKSSLSELQPKRIGTILREADLVSIPQLDLALKDQENFPDLRLGEILAMRGWIKAETANFFVQDWSKILQEKNRQPLGQYLIKSGLLEPTQLETILEEQKQTGIRFGTIAVMQGFLKSTTLDFFLMYLFPEEIRVSPFVNMYRTIPLEISSNETEFEELDPVFFEEWEDEELVKENNPHTLEDLPDTDTDWAG